MADEGKLWQRRADVDEVIKLVRDRWHPHLSRASIVGLGRPKCVVKDGKEILAKLKVAEAMEKVLWDEDSLGADYIVVVGLNRWEDMNETTRLALIDHELMHAGGESEPESGKWLLREHDIEEFTDIIERHGAWRRDLGRFIAASQAVQLELGMVEDYRADRKRREEAMLAGNPTIQRHLRALRKLAAEGTTVEVVTGEEGATVAETPETDPDATVPVEPRKRRRKKGE